MYTHTYRSTPIPILKRFLVMSIPDIHAHTYIYTYIQIHINSDLQEISRNIDTMSLSKPKSLPPLLQLGAMLEYPQFEADKRSANVCVRIYLRVTVCLFPRPSLSRHYCVFRDLVFPAITVFSGT